MIVAYLPEPEKHPLWADIVKLLEPAMLDGAQVIDTAELVWIAFEGSTLFGAWTTALLDGDDIAVVLACGGYQHRKWFGQGEAMMTAWARACGARKLITRGRKGWARYCRAFGWVASNLDDGRTLYEKAL